MPHIIEIDPTTHASLVELMDTYADTEDAISGVNESGEPVTVSILCDRIITKTYQSNNWTRINTYWRDGTREETYTR